MIASVIAAIVVLFLAVGTSPITIPAAQFAVAAVRCGHQPVEATSFAAADSYRIPGDVGYGPSLFSEYYCTEDDARAHGFHRTH